MLSTNLLYNVDCVGILEISMTKTEVCRLCDLDVTYGRLFIFTIKNIFVKFVIDSVHRKNIINKKRGVCICCITKLKVIV